MPLLNNEVQFDTHNACSCLGYELDQWRGQKTIQHSDKITHTQKLLHLKTTTPKLSPTSKGLAKPFRRVVLPALCRASGSFWCPVNECPEVKESKRHCRLFKAKSSWCFYERSYFLGHILQSRALFSKWLVGPPKILEAREDVLSGPDSELGLADILIDDITDAELLLLLHPHELHTLVDKNVLLLCLYHRHPVWPHIWHQP